MDLWIEERLEASTLFSSGVSTDILFKLIFDVIRFSKIFDVLREQKFLHVHCSLSVLISRSFHRIEPIFRV